MRVGSTKITESYAALVDSSLSVRAYWPKAAIIDDSWTPPPVQPAR